MKLQILKALLFVLRPVASTLAKWQDELEWRIVAETPVGPNPFEQGTIDWYLHEEGNRLRAEFRLEVVERSAWNDLLDGTHYVSK